jgi:hypothetical protein
LIGFALMVAAMGVLLHASSLRRRCSGAQDRLDREGGHGKY